MAQLFVFDSKQLLFCEKFQFNLIIIPFQASNYI